MQIVQWSTDKGFVDIPNGPEAAFAIYDHVYVVSRYGNQNYMFRSKLDEEKNPTTWTSEMIDGSIPVVGGNFIAHPNRLYIVGGMIDNTPTNSVYYAQVKSNRTLGAWKRSRNLSLITSNASVVYWEGSVYLFGGKDYSGVATNRIVRIDFNDIGTIQKVVTLPEVLPINLYNSTPLVYKNNVFLFGGNTGSFPTTNIIRVLKDQMNNGQLIIRYLNPLPIALEKPAVGQLGDKIFVIGGKTIKSEGGIEPSKNTYISYFNTKGSLQFWATDLQLPYDLDELSLVGNKSAFYILGGLINNHADRLIVTPRFYGDTNDHIANIDNTIKTKLTKQIRFLNVSIVFLISVLVILTVVFNFYF